MKTVVITHWSNLTLGEWARGYVVLGCLLRLNRNKSSALILNSCVILGEISVTIAKIWETAVRSSIWGLYPCSLHWLRCCTEVSIPCLCPAVGILGFIFLILIFPFWQLCGLTSFLPYHYRFHWQSPPDLLAELCYHLQTCFIFHGQVLWDYTSHEWGTVLLSPSHPLWRSHIDSWQQQTEECSVASSLIQMEAQMCISTDLDILLIFLRSAVHRDI